MPSTDSLVPRTGERAHDVVLAHIETELREGRLSVGDRLPGERALAEQFGISRASVRDAIRTLEVMGVVRSATGSGPKSGTVVVSDPTSALGQALRLHVASRHLPVADIVQARIMMETWCLSRAAGSTWEPAAIDEARALLDAMDDPSLPSKAFTALDAQFHVALSALAGNSVVSTMMESLRESTRGYVDEAVATLGNWDEIAADLRLQHRAIFEAVEAHDGERAARLVREHIEWFYAQTL
nr:FCD domain-containing protein [Sinomonas mesophila]